MESVKHTESLNKTYKLGGKILPADVVTCHHKCKLSNLILSVLKKNMKDVIYRHALWFVFMIQPVEPDFQNCDTNKDL